mgnify:CR=1 FL=1
MSTFSVRTVSSMVAGLAIVQDGGKIVEACRVVLNGTCHQLARLGRGEGWAFFETGDAGASRINAPKRNAACDGANPARYAFRNDPIRLRLLLLPVLSQSASAFR